MTFFFFFFQDLAVAMKKLGLNPTETEIQDLINEVEVDGLIYYQVGGAVEKKEGGKEIPRDEEKVSGRRGRKENTPHFFLSF